MEDTVRSEPGATTVPESQERLKFPDSLGPAWTSYAANPSGATFNDLLKATSVGSRVALLESMERQFHETSEWRTAQHLALLHLDRLPPHVGHADLVRALYFAHRACELSGQDPRARVVMARVSWERRLPLAVLHDTRVVLDGQARVRAEAGDLPAEAMLGEAFTLDGMARAYLQDVKGALEKMIQADVRGRLTVEAVVQLLLASEPDSPDAAEWAAARIPPTLGLGGRAAAKLKRAHRRRLIAVLRARLGKADE